MWIVRVGGVTGRTSASWWNWREAGAEGREGRDPIEREREGELLLCSFPVCLNYTSEKYLLMRGGEFEKESVRLCRGIPSER